MKRRKLFTLFGGFCLVLILAALPFMAACAKSAPAPTPTPVPPAEPITFKVLSIFGPTHNGTIWLRRFLDIVNERAKGELIMEFIGGPEVIARSEIGLAVQSNIIQMVSTYAGVYGALVEDVVQPLSFSRLSAQQERESGVYDYFNEVFNRNGLYFLGRTVTSVQPGSFFFMLTKLVETPQDFAGMKIQVESIWVKFLTEELKVSPITIADPDVYTAAERGLVEGAIMTFDDAWSNSLQEVFKYILDHPSMVGSTARVVNLEAWNKLPAHLRDIVIEAQLEEEIWATEEGGRRRIEMRQKFLDAGVQFIKFSSEDDATRFIDALYRLEWESLMERAPEHTAKVREIIEQ